MFAAKRLLCAAAVALCWPAAAAFAQSANPATPPGAAPAGMAPLPNAVTPPPPRANVLSEPGLPNRPVEDRSPLLNPEGAGNPNLPLLPNASPEEPLLRSPLLRIDTP